MAGIPCSRPCATAAARSEGCSRPRTRRAGSRRRSATSRPSPRSSVPTRSTGSSGRTPSIRGFISRPGRCPSPALETLAPDALVVVLDQITDPHNVGAIVRSCAAFGVDAVVTTARHSPAATGVLAKSASGGLEHVPFLTVRNLAEALIALGERGFARVGFDSSGEAELGAVAARRPLALVLGAEGKGLRQRTRECCDVVARLDMPGAIKSLNVSNAAAVALYALSRRLTSPAAP